MHACASLHACCTVRVTDGTLNRESMRNACLCVLSYIGRSITTDYNSCPKPIELRTSWTDVIDMLSGPRPPPPLLPLMNGRVLFAFLGSSCFAAILPTYLLATIWRCPIATVSTPRVSQPLLFKLLSPLGLLLPNFCSDVVSLRLRLHRFVA